jgi:hypothetical protein
MVGPEGQLWLDDYPYAQDGLDLWGALLEYFTAYLQLYYSSNEEVVADSELQAWWAEVKVRVLARDMDAGQLCMCCGSVTQHHGVLKNPAEESSASLAAKAWSAPVQHQHTCLLL